MSLDRSTLADWVGHAARELRPVHVRLVETLKGSPKLFADETRAPAPDPGRGRTKTGWLRALARDDRLAGAIFGATHATFDECIERSLFGLPMQHRPMVEQVARERQHTVLFLFNYSSRMLHGVFGVAGEAGFPLERHAWVAGAWSHDTQSEVRGRWPATRFSAQVRILRFKVSPPPVHMDKLAHVLDVKNGRINKIHQVLSREQTAELLRIFERETDAARARDRY